MTNFDEISVGIVSLVSVMAGAVSGWTMGGKQKAKNESTDAITKGTDQIVETSTKLLAKLDQMLNEERVGRKCCEDSLTEHKKLINSLSKKITELEKKLQ